MYICTYLCFCGDMRVRDERMTVFLRWEGDDDEVIDNN